MSKLYSLEQGQSSSLLFSQEINEKITLYELLVELFGERLILKLNVHFSTANKSATSRNPKTAIPSSSISNEQLQHIIDKTFMIHQKREGFMSLHHLICSQRLVATAKKSYKHHHVLFHLKKYGLPVHHNVLKLQPGKSQSSIHHPTIWQKKFSNKMLKLNHVHKMCVHYDVASCWV